MRMGNDWAGVSQVLGPATEPWIRDTDAVDDKTAKKWLAEHEKIDQYVQLVEVDSRVTFVSKRKLA